MNNVRQSKKRDAMLALLQRTVRHPSADWVYQQMKVEFPDLSLGTVYRNLTLLAEEGEIRRLNVGDGVDRFDGDVSPHYHFVCQKCGQVLDLQIDGMEEIDYAASENFHGRIAGHVTYFYGLCGSCADQTEDPS